VTGRPSYPNPALRNLPPGVQRPNVWYRLMRRFLQVTFSGIWKVRVFNRHYEPASGGALYICNHQSFLDPVLMSLGLRRPMNYAARDSLFRFPVFRGLIRSLNAFPVRRASADLSFVKEAMRRLKAGGQVVMFAEGTRTVDGRVGRLLQGMSLLAQRSADWVVPVVIDGAFEAWPRWQLLPSPGQIVVQYAKPLSRAETRRLSQDQLLQRVRQDIIDMQAEVRRRLGRPPLAY